MRSATLEDDMDASYGPIEALANLGDVRGIRRVIQRADLLLSKAARAANEEEKVAIQLYATSSGHKTALQVTEELSLDQNKYNVVCAPLATSGAGLRQLSVHISPSSVERATEAVGAAEVSKGHTHLAIALDIGMHNAARTQRTIG